MYLYLQHFDGSHTRTQGLILYHIQVLLSSSDTVPAGLWLGGEEERDGAEKDRGKEWVKMLYMKMVLCVVQIFFMASTFYDQYWMCFSRGPLWFHLSR